MSLPDNKNAGSKNAAAIAYAKAVAERDAEIECRKADLRRQRLYRHDLPKMQAEAKARIAERARAAEHERLMQIARDAVASLEAKRGR